MKPANILEQVQQGADARFGETIERLLFLLTEQNYIDTHIWQYIVKWTHTGLLDGIPDSQQPIAAERLEKKAQELAKESSDCPVAKFSAEWEEYVIGELKKIIQDLKPVGPCYCDQAFPRYCYNCKDG